MLRLHIVHLGDVEFSSTHLPEQKKNATIQWELQSKIGGGAEVAN